MLAIPELLHEAALTSSLDEVLSRCVREIPLYRNNLERSRIGESGPLQLQRWPLITKEDIRRGFPSNFLGKGTILEELVDREVIELLMPFVVGPTMWHA